MEGSVMRKLAGALGDVGFVIKKIEEEAYGQFDRPPSTEKRSRGTLTRRRRQEDDLSLG
jgi:hypothetical protein